MEFSIVFLPIFEGDLGHMLCYHYIPSTLQLRGIEYRWLNYSTIRFPNITYTYIQEFIPPLSGIGHIVEHLFKQVYVL